MVFYFIYFLHGLFLEKILLINIVIFCITAPETRFYAASASRCGLSISQSIFNGSKRSRRAPGATPSTTTRHGRQIFTFPRMARHFSRERSFVRDVLIRPARPHKPTRHTPTALFRLRRPPSFHGRRRCGSRVSRYLRKRPEMTRCDPA